MITPNLSSAPINGPEAIPPEPDPSMEQLRPPEQPDELHSHPSQEQSSKEHPSRQMDVFRVNGGPPAEIPLLNEAGSPAGSVGPSNSNPCIQSLAELLPEPWRRFCEIHERTHGIPADMTAVCLVGAISGLTAGHVVGECGDLEVPSNLLMLIITPPAGFKSRCFKLVTSPLLQAQGEGIANSQAEWEQVSRPDAILCEEEIRQARRELRNTSNARPLAQQVAMLERAKVGFEQLRPGRGRYILDDVTVAARNRAIIGAQRNAIFQCSADARPHLKALLSGSGLGREKEMHLFLTGFSGEALSIDRIVGNQATTVDSAIMAVMFGVQDDLAAEFFADRILTQSGLLSRFLGFSFCRPPAGGLRLGGPEAGEALQEWRSHVNAWSEFKREIARSGPLRIPFSPEAIRLLENLEPLFPSSANLGNPLMQGYSSRYQEHVLRLALNISLLRQVGWDVICVNESDVEVATVFLRRAVNDAVAMAGRAGLNAARQTANRLTCFLQNNGGSLHLTHGNPSGFSLKILQGLADSFPDEFEIVPVRKGGSGRPQKHLWLRDSSLDRMITPMDTRTP